MSFDLKIAYGNLVIKDGQLKQVRDSEKLIQDISKIALTPANSNIFNPWYGSYINKTLIGSSLDETITVQMSQAQLSNALDNLINLQKEQMRSDQPITPDEHIRYVSDISIRRNKQDPRRFDVIIKVISKGSKPVTTSFTQGNI